MKHFVAICFLTEFGSEQSKSLCAECTCGPSLICNVLFCHENFPTRALHEGTSDRGSASSVRVAFAFSKPEKEMRRDACFGQGYYDIETICWELALDHCSLVLPIYDGDYASHHMMQNLFATYPACSLRDAKFFAWARISSCGHPTAPTLVANRCPIVWSTSLPSRAILRYL